jgi:FAD/FMN-containing dehydrogenase
MESPYAIYGERRSRAKPKAKPSGVSRKSRAASESHIALPPFPAIADAVFLTPSKADYAKTLPLHNKRNTIAPALRIMCTSTQAVSDCVKWIADHDLPLALRSGGHCYEGFSQSHGVVIDVRRMGLVTIDAANRIAAVSAGASLGKVYRAVAAKGLALAAGSCPTVGVAGHTLGGGQGLLGRRHGLACDNLVSVKLVDASGNIRVATAAQDADLFWAARGGGGGSFGVATRFEFKLHPLQHVLTFGITWTFSKTSSGLAKAAKVFDAWQRWAPKAPHAITAIMKVQKTSEGKLRLRMIGQSTGTEEELANEINAHVKVEPPSSALAVTRRSFIDAVETFAGSFDYETIYMKAKSDFVQQPLSTAGIGTLFDQILKLQWGHVVALCDAYGGAIADVAPAATAFPYRGEAAYAIQYYSRWTSAADTPARLASIAKLYAAMRPFMSGAAYVNYCDMDVANYASAYWGGNLARLKQIKHAADPENRFKHGQSVPVG